MNTSEGLLSKLSVASDLYSNVLLSQMKDTRYSYRVSLQNERAEQYSNYMLLLHYHSCTSC